METQPVNAFEYSVKSGPEIYTLACVLNRERIHRDLHRQILEYARDVRVFQLIKDVKPWYFSRIFRNHTPVIDLRFMWPVNQNDIYRRITFTCDHIRIGRSFWSFDNKGNGAEYSVIEFIGVHVLDKNLGIIDGSRIIIDKTGDVPKINYGRDYVKIIRPDSRELIMDVYFDDTLTSPSPIRTSEFTYT